jgi:hypothetical protein
MNYLVRRIGNRLIIFSKKIHRSISIPWNPLPDYEDQASLINPVFLFWRGADGGDSRWRTGAIRHVLS